MYVCKHAFMYVYGYVDMKVQVKKYVRMRTCMWICSRTTITMIFQRTHFLSPDSESWNRAKNFSSITDYTAENVHVSKHTAKYIEEGFAEATCWWTVLSR